MSLVRDAWDYRFLIPEQVSRLHNISLESAMTMLNRLTEAGYLAAIPRPVISTREPNFVYALDQRGADEIAAQLGTDRKAVLWRKYHNQVGRQYMDHRLAVNDVRIALTVGAQRNGGGMVRWLYEPVIREWQVDDPDGFAPPLRLRPDAYVHVAAEGVSPRSIHAFVEVDMGTESHARFTSKIRRYLAYKASLLFRTRYGGRAFRVLTVALTQARASALRRGAEAQGGQKLFWFARLGNLTQGALPENSWQIAGVDAADSSKGHDLFAEPNR
jgi:hypothetical protein